MSDATVTAADLAAGTGNIVTLPSSGGGNVVVSNALPETVSGNDTILDLLDDIIQDGRMSKARWIT